MRRVEGKEQHRAKLVRLLEEGRMRSGLVRREKAAEDAYGDLEEVDLLLRAKRQVALDPRDRLGHLGVHAHQHERVE